MITIIPKPRFLKCTTPYGTVTLDTSKIEAVVVDACEDAFVMIHTPGHTYGVLRENLDTVMDSWMQHVR